MSDMKLCPICGSGMIKWEKTENSGERLTTVYSGYVCNECSHIENTTIITQRDRPMTLSDFGFVKSASVGDYKKFDRFNRMETPLGRPIVTKDTLLVKGRKVTYLPNGHKSQIVPPRLWEACMLEADKDGVEDIINTQGLKLKEQDAPISEAEWLEEVYGLDIFKKENEDNE